MRRSSFCTLRGNFTLSCWLLRARRRESGHGDDVSIDDVGRRLVVGVGREEFVRDAIASLRARGKTRIYLAGLSNGGIGASRLAPRLADEKLAGLVLVSGAAPDARASTVPTLVLQGRNDTQVSAAVVHAYASRSHAKYVEYTAGHFVLLVDRDHVAAAITDWLVRTDGPLTSRS